MVDSRPLQSHISTQISSALPFTIVQSAQEQPGLQLAFTFAGIALNIIPVIIIASPKLWKSLMLQLDKNVGGQIYGSA